MPEHTHHHAPCTDCGRVVVRCTGCGEPFPHGEPGWLDANGWHTGTRPTTAAPQTLAQRELERHQAEADEAVEAWRSAAAERHNAEQEFRRQSATVLTPGGGMTERVPAGGAQRIEKLVAAEDLARERRDTTGRRLVEARQRANAAA